MAEPNIELWKVPNYLDKELSSYRQKIITRFPPEPSGFLHVGHAKAAFINYVIAKKYKGEMILRFDNTNPNKETCEFEEVITQDIASLGIVPSRTTHMSDYFPVIMDFCEKLLSEGKAYVDDTLKEQMAEERMKRIESACRGNSIEKNMEVWNLLKKKHKITGTSIRIKMNMKSDNSSLRDPCIFRYIDLEGKQNDKWKYPLYPSYDFACPIVDSIEGVTHVFRSTEFAERDEQYNEILNILQLRKPLLFSYGKLNFIDSVMSKRKIKQFIDNGAVRGWDDPQLITLRGVFNRGMHVEPLKEFIAKVGFSKNVNNMTQDKMWSINRKYIDKISTRFFALPTDKCIAYKIVGLDGGALEKEIPRFSKNVDLGMRILKCSNLVFLNTDDVANFQNEEEITLMSFSNAIVKCISEDEQYSYLVYNPKGDYKTTKQKVSWVSIKDSVDVVVSTYNKDRTEFGKPMITRLIGESCMKYIEEGEYVQLIKMGYYICDNVENNTVYLTEIN